MNGKGIAVIGLLTVVIAGLGFMLLIDYLYSISPTVDASFGILGILPYILVAGAIVIIGVAVGRVNSF